MLYALSKTGRICILQGEVLLNLQKASLAPETAVQMHTAAQVQNLSVITAEHCLSFH